MYTIFGSENSPYSIKVRAYFRYKGIAHEWLLRAQHPDAFAEVAKIPIIPAVRMQDGTGMQDSTPIIDRLEEKFPEPQIHPDEPALRFVSELLEEFGDEWANKWMFHYRWKRQQDIDEVSLRLATENIPDAPLDARQKLAAAVADRMGSTSPSGGRGFAVGSNEVTSSIIEMSFVESIELLNVHLKSRSFLFGTAPAYGDFGLAPQVYQALLDPTAGHILRERAPRVVDWCTSMVWPSKPESIAFETWNQLQPTLEPFLSVAVSKFLTWSEANANAVLTGATEMAVDLGADMEWWQTIGGPQRYHAKSLQVLRKKYRMGADSTLLNNILSRCGCLTPIATQNRIGSMPPKL